MCVCWGGGGAGRREGDEEGGGANMAQIISGPLCNGKLNRKILKNRHNAIQDPTQDTKMGNSLVSDCFVLATLHQNTE